VFTSQGRSRTRWLVGTWLVIALVLSGPIASARWAVGEHATPEQWAQHVLLEALGIRHHHTHAHDPVPKGDVPADAVAADANSGFGAVVMTSPDAVGSPFSTADFGQPALATLMVLWFVTRVRRYRPDPTGIGASGPLLPPPRPGG
jgi:hypothetical protein